MRAERGFNQRRSRRVSGRPVAEAHSTRLAVAPDIQVRLSRQRNFPDPPQRHRFNVRKMRRQQPRRLRLLGAARAGADRMGVNGDETFSLFPKFFHSKVEKTRGTEAHAKARSEEEERQLRRCCYSGCAAAAASAPHPSFARRAAPTSCESGRHSDRD